MDQLPQIPIYVICLKFRSEYLLERAEVINSTLDHSINTSSPSILPTGQALFNFLMESDSTSRDYQESVRIAAVHRYELLNLLIRESFALCALDDLQPRTLNLLRSAVQLHPILIGERQDLGHPDETNFYGLLETIVTLPIPSEKSDKAPKKCPLSALHRLANNLRREHPKLDINYLRAIIHTLNMTEKEGVRDSFSRVQENLEVQILLAHFTKKFVQFKNLGTPSGQGVEYTPFELGEWPYKLPDPPFLRKSRPSAETPGTSETNDFSSMPAPEPVKHQATEAEKDLHQGECSVPKVELTPTQERQQQEETAAAPARPWSFQKDWVLPQGLRSFHRLMMSNPQPPGIKLTTQNQEVVDRLFDSQQQCSVTYKEFKRLWEAIGGKIIANRGGSHRELITPLAQKIFGIWAHNDKETYGKAYVKYLQTALLYVGLRPSDLAVLSQGID